MKLSPERIAAFCGALACSCQVGKAAAAVGISRVTAYEWRNNSPEFAKMWDQAMKVGLTALEDEAHRRAFEGNPEPLVHKGQFTYLFSPEVDPETGLAHVLLDAEGKPLTAAIKRYSDTLAIFLLKAHDPNKYRENSRVEMAGSLEITHASDDDIDQELAELEALEQARSAAPLPVEDFDDLA